MKTIKIFLASSEELDYDRMAFGNLVRRLDDIYEKRGIRIKLFEWEDYDAAYNDRRKQDEYNDHVRESDIFLALFHKKAGQFTIEEFDIASEEFKEHASPKVFAFCKDIRSGEEESPELAEFKKRLFDEMGHYWCRYDTRESLHLQFVMQLQLVESSQMGELKVEDGNVTMDGICIAPMDKLKFAAANEDYQKMSEELADFPKKIEKARMRLERYPDDEDLIDDLQQNLNKYNKLKEDFEQFQQLLFNTAKRVAQLQGERITERMRRAMDAFSEGKAREANIILDEAEADARRNLEDYKQSKEITELKRQAVISSIEELQLKASTVMADASIPIGERIAQTEQIYAQANEMAKEIDYDKEKYAKFLQKYGVFLYDYANYEKAVDVDQRLITLSEELYGSEHQFTVSSYNNLALVYAHQGNFDEALELFQKVLDIRKKTLGDEHPDTAISYDDIGSLYADPNNPSPNYSEALEYITKAISIREKTIGPEHPDTATSYNNYGLVCHEKNNYTKALEYYLKAHHIFEKVYGLEKADIATFFNNIGCVYCDLGKYSEALEYHSKALSIRTKLLGLNHPDTANSYENIGDVYERSGDFQKAMEYYYKAKTSRSTGQSQ